MSVLSKIVNGYQINCVLFIAGFMASGIFFTLGFACFVAGREWDGLVECVYGALATTLGIWQLTIFLNKYIYYRVLNEIKNGVSNEF